MKPITVVLAEDHAIVRDGLRLLLETAGDITVVGEAATGREAVTLARELRPDVVVMDVAMPLLNGFEATRQIRRGAPATRVLVLSAHGDDEYVARMAEVGAAGYLVKQSSAQVLIHAVREIAAGRAYSSAAITRRRAAAVRRAREDGRPRDAARVRPLTSREAEVLQLVAEGAPNKRIAVELGISIKTVEKHRQQLMNKLDIHDTAGLTRHAIASGVIESGTPDATD